jgi:hypothetical protein
LLDRISDIEDRDEAELIARDVTGVAYAGEFLIDNTSIRNSTDPYLQAGQIRYANMIQMVTDY